MNKPPVRLQCPGFYVTNEDGSAEWIPSHVMLSHFVSRDGDERVTRVVFWTFDTAAGCNVEHEVALRDFVRFKKRRPHLTHTICAVVTNRDRRIEASGRSILWGSDKAYKAVHPLARGTYIAYSVGGGRPLFEIEGVSRYGATRSTRTGLHRT